MRRLGFGIVAVVGLMGFGRWWTAVPAASDDPRLFANRVWMERTPKSDRDLVLRLVAVDVAGKKAGLVNRSSKYAFGGEVFSWTLDGATLVLNLPQQQAKARLKMRSWSCGNEAPAGFDLCLSLSDGKNELRLFSKKGWKSPKAEELPVPLETLELPADGDDRPVGLEGLTSGL